MSNRRHRSRTVSLHELTEAIADSKSQDNGGSTVQTTNAGIVIPHGTRLEEVISMLSAIQGDREKENEGIEIDCTIPVPFWEGARALLLAIKQELGIVRQLKDDYGKRVQFNIEISQGKVEQIPWGDFDLPGLSGYVKMVTVEYEKLLCFGCKFKVSRRYESRVHAIQDRAYDIALKECLHRGKAFTMIFRDDEGRLKSSTPYFFPLINEKPLFNKEVLESIERNVLVPIKYADQLATAGFSLKRSVLLAGEYGLGKTLAASFVAGVATEAKWTFIYVKNGSELPDALRFAMRYQPVVVFAEDIDRIAGIERTDKVNQLLNQLDGIDSKAVRLFTVLTTNHPDKINPAMLRPGRIDAVIKVPPPDAGTIEQMLRTFGGSRLADDTDLTEAAVVLDGQSPARVREVLQRSALEVLRRTGNLESRVLGSDLSAIAKEVVAEKKVSEPQ